MGKIDIALSESGKNAHYHHCAIKDQRCNYAVCLNTIKKSKNGTLRPQSDRNNCDQTIKVGECPAVEMRQQEIKAGDALYYMPREKPDPSYIKGWQAVKNGSAKSGETSVKGGGKPYVSSGIKTPYKPATAKAQPKKKTHAEHMEIDVSKVLSDVAKQEAKKVKQEEISTKAKQQSKPLTTASEASNALALMMGQVV